MQGIKNIILDLGGIFLNVDYTLTEKAFVALGVTNFNEFYSQHNANHLFEQFETGKISPDNFCEEFRKNLQNQPKQSTNFYSLECNVVRLSQRKN